MTTKKMSVKSEKSLAFLKKLTRKKMSIGNMLWSIRECDELSQADFAKLLGVSRQYLCDVERGRRIVSPKTAAEFAEKLGYSPMHFIQIAIQDELNKYGFHFDIQLQIQKKAA